MYWVCRVAALLVQGGMVKRMVERGGRMEWWKWDGGEWDDGVARMRSEKTHTCSRFCQ